MSLLRGTVGKFWLYHMLGHIFGLGVLGPGVFTPPSKKGDIASIAETRADVGYQFMLMLQVGRQ